MMTDVPMAEEIIVIPDVHGRGFWKEAVAKYPNADTIFLGDYLDPYPDEDIDDEDAFNNFLDIIEFARNHSNVTLLFGNHDLQYWFLYDWGHRMKDWEDDIFEVFRNNMDLFHMFAVRYINGKRWLFSHAPLFEEWIDYTKLPHGLDQINDKVWEMLKEYNRNSTESWQTNRAAHDRVWKTLGRASKLRGGIDDCGSPVWADVREIAHGCNLYKDADYYVFGHTQMNKPLITDKFACLDTHQAYIINALGEIKAITSKTTPELPNKDDLYHS